MHLFKSRRRVVLAVGFVLLLLTSASAVFSYANPFLLHPKGTKPVVPPIRDDNFGGGGTLLLPTVRNVGEGNHVNYVLMDASGKNEKPLWADYDNIPNNPFASFVGDKGDIVFSGSTANDETVGPYKDLKLELYLTNLNGAKPEKLPDGDDAQDWIASPDGKYLALNILYDDNAGLNLYDMETKTRTRIVPTEPTDTRGPASPLFFTADSKRLIFKDNVAFTYQIYDLADKTIKPVTTDEAFSTLGFDKFAGTSGPGVNAPLAVSISKSGEITSCEITDNNKTSLFIRADWTSAPTELLKIEPQKPPCFTVRWSPDGKYLLYGGFDSSADPFSVKYLALSVSDGKATLLREMLFTGQSYFQNADWSPLSR